MSTGIEYRRFDLADKVTVFIIKKADISSKDKAVQEQIENLLTGSNRKILQGNTYTQLNGYRELSKKITWDKKTEKVFVCVEQ